MPLSRRSAIVCLAAVLAVLGFATTAAAGVHYEAVTLTEGPGKPQTLGVEAWVDGSSAKVLFTESNNPMAGSGTYVLTRDGGETVLLVNPEEKTYAEWDMEAMLAGLNQVMEQVGPLLNLEITDIEVEKLLEEPGGSLHGMSTTHYRYRTSYQMTVKVLGMGRSNLVERLQDIWSTRELNEPAMGLWLRKTPTTGHEQLDQLIAAEMEKAQGFPLKSVEVTTSTDKKGRETVTRSSTEVTVLERGVAVPAATFEIPEGYTRTEMAVPGAGAPEGEEGGRNPFKKIFGGGGR